MHSYISVKKLVVRKRIAELIAIKCQVTYTDGLVTGLFVETNRPKLGH